MNLKSRRRAVILGHLTITLPSIAPLPLMLFAGWHVYGPWLRLYYVLAGLTLGWQWYSFAFSRWKKDLRMKGVEEGEVESLARQAGLAWRGAENIGCFALHTSAAAACVLYLSQWLIGRWFFWVLPIAGVSRPGWWEPRDYYMQHLAVASIVPAFVGGYFLSRRFPKLSMWAWVIPTFAMAYTLIQFRDPSKSIFFASPHHFVWFSYFFGSLTHMPRLDEWGSPDMFRALYQMLVVAPFYSGVAYSVGALLAIRTMDVTTGFLPVRAEAEHPGTSETE